MANASPVKVKAIYGRLLEAGLHASRAVAAGGALTVWARKLSGPSAQILSSRFLAARGGGRIWIRMDGRCMEPTVRRGDEILVALGEPVGAGDVALFQGLDHPAAHRLLAWLDIGNVRYALQSGDNGRATLVLEPDVLGPVVEVRSADLQAPRSVDRANVGFMTVIKALGQVVSGGLYRFSQTVIKVATRR